MLFLSLRVFDNHDVFLRIGSSHLIEVHMPVSGRLPDEQAFSIVVVCVADVKATSDDPLYHTIP
jgi:hypothetical protein